MLIVKKVADQLKKQKKSIAIAESCTGGLLANILTNIPGSSSYFILGITAYHNDAKNSILKIPSDLLNNKKIGAVSSEVAERMANNVRKLAKTDFGIAITGIAGPDGSTKAKPVGTTYIAVSTKDETLCYQCFLKGDRKSIKLQAAKTALQCLLEFLC